MSFGNVASLTLFYGFIITDILDADVLQLARIHGWDSVSAVFILIKDLANLAKMSPCASEMLAVIADAVFASFKQNQSLMMSLLGNWVWYLIIQI